MKKIEAIDESGNAIEYDKTSDVGQLITLLEYCRARGFKLGPNVQVGSVTAQVRDLKHATKNDPEDEADIWDLAGLDRSHRGG